MKVRSFPASSHCYARNVGESTAHSLVDRMHRCATILDDMARLSFYDSLGSRPLHLMNSVGDGSLQRVRRVGRPCYRFTRPGEMPTPPPPWTGPPSRACKNLPHGSCRHVLARPSVALGQPIDLSQHAQAVSAMVRVASRLGLQRRAWRRGSVCSEGRATCRTATQPQLLTCRELDGRTSAAKAFDRLGSRVGNQLHGQ